MSQVTSPVILDSTGQDISAKLQAIANAINGGTIDPLSITQNGTYTPSGTTLGYGPVTVAVPNSYTAGDEGKVVSNGQLVAQTAHAEVTANGTIDTTLNDSVVVNVSGGGVPTSGLPYVMNRSGTTAQRLICTLRGREFYKSYNDPCFAAWITRENGQAGPFLVSETVNGVTYGQSYDSSIFGAAGNITYNGKVYYYSGNQYWLTSDTSTAGFAQYLGQYDLTDGGLAEAAKDLLDLVFGGT